MMHVMNMSLVFWTSVFLVSCAHQGPGLKMMDERASYSDNAPETSELNLSSSQAIGEEGKLLARPEPRVAQVWIYPQRLSDHEHFWGAWLSLRLEDHHWEAASSAMFEQASPLSRPNDNKQLSKGRRKKMKPQ